MNLLKALTAVSGMTFLSRITGLVRESAVAALAGGGDVADAWIVAQRVPNLLRRLFAEGAFSQAFVPVLAEYKTQRGDAEALSLVGRTATLLGLVVAVVTVLAMVAAPAVAYVFGSGYSAVPGKLELTSDLLRICFPYILFVSLTSVLGALLNAYGHFSVAAFSPVLLNLAMISAALVFSQYFDPPVMALAWGMFAGGLLQFALLYGRLAALGKVVRLKFSPKDEGVRRILALMAPALLGVSVAQISMLINTEIGSHLGSGAVASLSYADRLMEFPSALLGVAAGTIVLPSLSKHFANEDQAGYSSLLDWGLRITLLLAVPATVALAVLALPLCATIYLHGQYTAANALQTAPALIAYSVGLLGIIAVKLLAPAFFARKDVGTPARVAIIALVSTQLMNLLLVPLFHRYGLGHAALALTTGLGACLNAGVLWVLLRRRGIYQPQPGWWRFFAKIVVAVLVMAALLWLLRGTDRQWLTAPFWQRIGHMAILVAGGAGAYFAALFAMGFRLRDFLRRESP